MLLSRLPQWMPGKTVSLGIDEVGWGAGAGPLLVAAVGLYYPVDGLRDSKILRPTQRDRVYERIWDSAVFVHFAFRDVDFINQHKLGPAWQSAVLECLQWIDEDIPGYPIVLDGNASVDGFPSHKYMLLPNADNIIPGCMAASVLAKVTRDRIMTELNQQYPGYDLAQNKGYLTGTHIAAIGSLGLSPQHRYTAKKFVGYGNLGRTQPSP